MSRAGEPSREEEVYRGPAKHLHWTQDIARCRRSDFPMCRNSDGPGLGDSYKGWKTESESNRVPSQRQESFIAV